MKIIRLIPCLLALGLTAAPAEEEKQPLKFYSLFNGEDLDGWTGEGYIVEDGAIVCTPEGKNLVTESTFSNYVLDLEFKLPPGGNNGIGIHYPGKGNPADVGMEVQVLDNSAEKYADLKPGQFHGSLYLLAAAEKGHLKPVGEWNLQRIIVNGPTVEVNLNGHTILEADLDELAEKHPDHEGVKRRAGHLALCGHGDRVAFRKPRIAEIPPAANEEGARAAGFEPIFDGRTLEGWRLGEGSEGHWVPINGILKYSGNSPAKMKHLWTEKSYEDFSLAFDWRWAEDGPLMERPIIGPDGNNTGETVEVMELDSGVFLRGQVKSQVNLWNWPAGSGEVWGYRTDNSQPAEVRAAVTPKVQADNPVGEWNRMLITLQDETLTVVLNGRTVIDGAELPGVPDEGPIGLQHHGHAIDFANLWIQEL
jgi:hypothetical protein